MATSFRLMVSLFFLAMPFNCLAEELEVGNHSFEQPVADFTSGVPEGWTAVKQKSPFGAWTENTPNTGMIGGAGFQHGALSSNDNGVIFQDLGIPFVANTTYQVEVATAHRSNHRNAKLEFGLFSSLNIGDDLGLAGFSDLHAVWTGSGNQDADNFLNQFRDSVELDSIGGGSLAEPYSFSTFESPPAGNIVVFLRITDDFGEDRRIQFDNVRVNALTLGDINCDGEVNLLDVSPFVAILSSGEYLIQADINRDGVVNLLDVGQFIDILSGN